MQLDCIGSMDDWSGRDCVMGLVVIYFGFSIFGSEFTCSSVLFSTEGRLGIIRVMLFL